MKGSDKIVINVILNDEVIRTINVTSLCAMWKAIKPIYFDEGLRTAIMDVTKNGEKFMYIHLVEKASGKPWMVNDIVENRESRIKKARRLAKQVKETETEAETEVQNEVQNECEICDEILG